MKALILSVRPEHAYNILTGKKTLEIRKRVPKNFKGWVYVYVTKGKPYLLWEEDWVCGTYVPHRWTFLNGYSKEQAYHIWGSAQENEDTYIGIVNGLVIMRFWFDEWEVVARTDYTRKISDTGLIPMMKSNGETYNNRIVVNMREDYEYDECKGSCLTTDELKDYGKGKDLYIWHIKNLEIFDKPMQLSEFAKPRKSMKQENKYWIHKAPQSYMYAWVKEEMK